MGKRGGARPNAGRPRKHKVAEEKHVLWFMKHKPGALHEGDVSEAKLYFNELYKTMSLKKAKVGTALVESGVGTGTWNRNETTDYNLLRELYTDWPLIRYAVDWAIDVALENGYRTESQNDQAKQICDAWAKIVHMDDEILPKWIMNIHLEGDIFSELVWEAIKVEGATPLAFNAPSRITCIPGDEIGYKRGVKGENLLFAQIVGGQAKVTWKFDAENFRHYSWRPLGNSIWGTPIIASVIDDTKAMIAFENDWNTIMEWYIKPLWHVIVGTPEKPASDTLVASVKNDWQEREPNADLITGGNIAITPHGVGDQMPNPEVFNNYHDLKSIDGLQSPFPHIMMKATQASAEEVRDNALARIIFIQRWLKRKMEELFAAIMLANNITDEVKATFQPLRAIILKDRIDKYVKLLDPTSVRLSKETRLEVEQSLRMEFLDLPRDDSLVQESDPLPGQQGLLGQTLGKLKKMMRPRRSVIRDSEGRTFEMEVKTE